MTNTDKMKLALLVLGGVKQDLNTPDEMALLGVVMDPMATSKYVHRRGDTWWGEVADGPNRGSSIKFDDEDIRTAAVEMLAKLLGPLIDPLVLLPPDKPGTMTKDGMTFKLDTKDDQRFSD